MRGTLHQRLARAGVGRTLIRSLRNNYLAVSPQTVSKLLHRRQVLGLGLRHLNQVSSFNQPVREIRARENAAEPHISQ